MFRVFLLHITLALCAMNTTRAQEESVCTDGQVRLTGRRFYYGQVEFCSAGVWSRVCADDFNDSEAQVVCRNLTLTGQAADLSEINVAISRTLGPRDTETPASVSAFDCNGNELSLSGCSPLSTAVSTCEPAGAICLLDFSPCCLVTCNPNSECVEGTTLADSTCSCSAGFSRNTDTGECENINECAMGDGLCTNGQCVDTDGSFTCTCNAGFTPSDIPRVCVDMDECTDSSEDLCANGECRNFVGGFLCFCTEAGFTTSSNGTACVDIDECVNEGLCPRGYECENTVGGFTCVRGPGRTRTHTHPRTRRPMMRT